MCTASWLADENGYRLLFNRDERKDRQKACSPKAYDLEGVKVIAPKDPKAGGSWIAVNEFGLSFALFNHYGAIVNAPVLKRPDSRGKIPLALARTKTLEEAISLFEKMDFSNTPPFVVMIVDKRGEVSGWSWDGKELVDTDLSLGVFTTSSFRTNEVESYRIERFHTLKENAQSGEDWRWGFQTDISNPDTAFNPLMDREESMTHCLTVVEVRGERVCCRYHERVMGEQQFGPAEQTELALRSCSEA